MICAICNGNQWESVDHIRAQPANMVVCKGCGFISFNRFRDSIDYETYYDHEYRGSKSVNIQNLMTTNRKLGYHGKFLDAWLKEKKIESVGEIGAGIGYLLRWFRDAHKVKNIHGSELTSSYRRYAKHAFNIEIAKDFNFAGTYDLVCLYHTAEHIPDIRGVLTRLHGCAKFLYMATPTWMEELMKFGGGQFTSFDDHFDPDHINAWSRLHFQALLQETGWKIAREDRLMYGYTVLCEAVEPMPFDHALFPEPKQVIEQLGDMLRASVAFMKGDFSEAMRLYPRFLDAYLAACGSVQNDFSRQMQIIDAAERTCPNSILPMIQRGLIFYQFNRLDDADRLLLQALESKPHDDNVLLHVALIRMKRSEILMRQGKHEPARASYREAVGILDKIIGINPTRYAECFNFIAYIFSVSPLEHEIAEKQFDSPHVEGAPHVNPMEINAAL